MNLNSKQLEAIFFKSLNNFTKAEAANILNGTSERNLCSRLGFVLETEVKGAGVYGYYADVEYNRKQQGAVKTILDDQMQVVRITCDLILHSRGESILNDNLIAVEMKRLEHPNAEKRKDRIRLRAMTKSSYDDLWSADGIAHPKHVCGYVLGYFVELDSINRNFLVEGYSGGELLSTKRHNF
ncbi:hypothetical protein [Pacificibacter marinus]|uniref:hypothetical protein n=1 Tax=Pacificibacter marinus TaxID=658057 RepID=UPI001C07980E|nr:hypothetical protein [Pacificibacter marinus]MBU2868448.1 hypothetical protein [Pacificibacter marinus]